VVQSAGDWGDDGDAAQLLLGYRPAEWLAERRHVVAWTHLGIAAEGRSDLEDARWWHERAAASARTGMGIDVEGRWVEHLRAVESGNAAEVVGAEGRLRVLGPR